MVLVLTVAALNLAIVAGRVWADSLMCYAQFCGGFLKQSLRAASLRMQAVGERKAVVGLYAFNRHAFTFEVCGCITQEVTEE